MGSRSGIEWTERTWNPSTGCERVLGPEDRDLFLEAAGGPPAALIAPLGPAASGCRNCYAMKQAARMQAMGVPEYAGDGLAPLSGPGFAVAQHPGRLSGPLRWDKPRLVFVNSMSDLMHAQVETDFIARVFAVMAVAGHHTFQLLTKRHGRLRALLNDEEFVASVREHASALAGSGVAGRAARAHWAARVEADPQQPVAWPLPNVWVGVSVENQRAAELRVPALLQTPAAVRWVSAEPLLGATDLSAFMGMPGGLDWVVVGGESGPGARPMHPGWARDLRDQCAAADVAYLFKQWGAWEALGPLGEVSVRASSGRFGVVGFGGQLRGMAFGSLSNVLAPFGGGPECEVVRRTGKDAGRLLDGVLHDGYPAGG